MSFFLVLTVIPAYSQFEQMKRTRGRINESVRAEKERERQQQLESGELLPQPKPATLNVDVQAVLAAADYKSFADARPHAAVRVTDGQPLWLYLKFKSRLGDYVLTVRSAEDKSKLQYLLFAEIGPKGDVTASNQYLLQFNKEDLDASELKINLAPGLTGHNRSIPLFLTAAGTVRPGLWTNEVRISNNPAVPRGLSQHLATAPVILDLKGGNPKYQKMNSEYDSIVLRGTADVSIMPLAGTFFDQSIKKAVIEKLAPEGLTPSNFYFAGDGWSDYSGSTMAMARNRKVFAVFTYEKAAKCYYGLAQVVQKYDFAHSKFDAPAVELLKDLAVPCAK